MFPESSLTPDNLSTVLDNLMDELWKVFSGYVNTPGSEVKRIERECSSDKDRKQAVIPCFISAHPSPSWTLVARALYLMGWQYRCESCHRSLDRLQQLFPTGRIILAHIKCILRFLIVIYNTHDKRTLRHLPKAIQPGPPWWYNFTLHAA